MLFDTTTLGYDMIRKYFSLPADSIKPITNILYHVNDDTLSSDIINVGSTTVEYPHIPDFGSATTASFKVDYNTAQPFTNYSIANYGGASPLVYMVGDSVWRTSGQLTGSTLKLLVPNDVSTKPVTCHVFNTVTNIPLSNFKPVNGTGMFTDYAALGVDSAFIILTHPKLLTGANAYAAYRSSPAGGQNNVVVIIVNELYDQFSAGIYKHSLAARRFCDFALDNWPSKPKYLFIIGKSVREASEGYYSGTNYGSRHDAGVYAESLVPSFGYPCSDNRITAGLNGTYLDPAIATGRLAAVSNAQVTDYLAKITEFELAQQDPIYTKANKEWMKQVQEFGGGSTASEQAQFQFFLNSYKAKLEDTSYGASVKAYYKTSSDPIDPVDFQEVNERINNGVSMMIFFGHGSIAGFDQNVDDVNNWQNQGKYPLLIGNSCFSGDIHQPGALSVSEDFTLIPNKGVIAFLSTVKQGFVVELNRYTDSIVRDISQTNYGLSIGQHIQHTLQANQVGIVIVDSINAIPPEEVYTGMTLHGDPSIKINTHQYPELVIESSDVFIEPANITLATDTMDVNLIITNLGRGTNQPFTANLTRQFPSGVDSTYSIVVNGVNYKDTVVFHLPVYHGIAYGINHF
ncbi:MAG TPA: C25 family cysteine peptidase, partial [Flavobacteriales bacterium]|nr:C25 family cysteine peptidase [Flavobacteriales bacterium]